MAGKIDIGVEITWTSTVSAEILRGVREFALTQPDWVLRHIDSPIPDDSALPVQQRWKPAAGIYAGGVAPFNGKFGSLTGPVVIIGDCSFNWDLRIDLDDAPVGKMAFQHFQDRGFVHFGFVGNDQPYSLSRYESFVGVLRKKGFSCSVCPRTPGSMKPRANKDVAAWLQSLPKPVGILCCHDPIARDLLSVCHAEQLRVPEEIAILGIDNDLVWCEASTPQLSSIIIPWRRFGWEAANWVERLLKGEKPKGDRIVWISPRDVMTRQSTDSIAVTDPDLARALAHIRSHACEGLSVKELVHATLLDRRALERKFAKFLNRSPHDEIRRVRIDRAKLLLSETALSPNQIAQKTGFSRKHFAAVFTQIVGVTPLKYRTREL